MESIAYVLNVWLGTIFQILKYLRNLCSKNSTNSFSLFPSQGDVIVSFDGVHVGCEGTVPFRSTERIGFRYLISKK